MILEICFGIFGVCYGSSELATTCRFLVDTPPLTDRKVPLDRILLHLCTGRVDLYSEGFDGDQADRVGKAGRSTTSSKQPLGSLLEAASSENNLIDATSSRHPPRGSAHVIAEICFGIFGVCYQLRR